MYLSYVLLIMRGYVAATGTPSDVVPNEQRYFGVLVSLENLCHRTALTDIR
jgi:hypothetical protein